MLIKLSQVLFNGQPLRLFCDLNADQAVSGFIQWSVGRWHSVGSLSLFSGLCVILIFVMLFKLSQVLFNSQPLRLFCDLNVDQAVSGFIQQSAFEAVL